MTSHRSYRTGQKRIGPRGPERIREAVSRLLSRSGYAQALTTDAWRAAWAEAAGSQLARDSRPSRLHRGVLDVIVRNSTVLQELTFQKKELLNNLCDRLPDNTIAGIRFRVGQLD